MHPEMNNKTGLALVGVALILLGAGTCVVASIGFVDRNVVDLPLGSAERHVEESTRSPLGGLGVGVIMIVVGIVLVSLSAAGDRDGEREEKSDPGSAAADSGETVETERENPL